MPLKTSLAAFAWITLISTVVAKPVADGQGYDNGRGHQDTSHGVGSSSACPSVLISYVTMTSSTTSSSSWSGYGNGTGSLSFPTGGTVSASATSPGSTMLNATSSTPSGSGSPTSSTNSASLLPASDCHHNNCLRQFLREPAVTPFCATYTTVANTASTGLPDYVSQCQNDPAQISSACSCIGTGSSTSGTSGISITSSGPTVASSATPTVPPYPTNSTCPVLYTTYTTTTTFIETITTAYPPMSIM